MSQNKITSILTGVSEAHQGQDTSNIIPLESEGTRNSNDNAIRSTKSSSDLTSCHNAQEQKSLPTRSFHSVSHTHQTSTSKLSRAVGEIMKPDKPSSQNEREKELVKDEGTDADLTSIVTDHHMRLDKPRRIRGLSHTRQASSRKLFGGFGEMDETVKLYQKIRASIKDGKYEKLEKLYTGSSQVATMEDYRIRYDAREKSLRQTFALTFFFLVVYFVAGGAILVNIGDVTIQNAILYSVYSMTSTGFGSVKVPLTSNGFLFFLIVFMFVGVALVVLVAAQMYICLSMEASNIKRYLDKQRVLRQELTTESESNTATSRGRGLSKVAGALLQCAASFERNFRKSECFRLSVVVGYLLFLLLVATVVMMHFEGWSFIEGLYFASYCMTTMGYGDIAPVTSGGIWFVIFWLPLNVTFISIYMGNLARYFMMASTAFSRRVYKGLIDTKKGSASDDLQVLSDAAHVCENLPSPHSGELSLQTMRDLVELVLESFLYKNHGTDEVSNVSPIQRFLHLQSPWTTSGAFHDNRVRKPSFALQVLMQERLIAIFSKDVTGLRTSLYEKDLTFVVTIDSLQDIAEKWMIPTGARDAFSIVALEAMIYIGEKRLVIEGVDTFLKMSPLECHKLFSPLLAAYEDAGTMEGWLAATEELAASCSSSIATFAMEVRGQGNTACKQVVTTETPQMNARVDLEPTLDGRLASCDNEEDLAMLAELSREYDCSMEEIQTMYLARYQSNRTIACWAITFFLCYEAVVTTFVTIYADLTISKGMLYTAYTITSAGFGSVPTPKTDGFLIFAVFNIFISISALAVVVAQAFVYLQSVALRREHARTKIIVAGRGQEVLARLCAVEKDEWTVRDVLRVELSTSLQMIPGSSSQAIALSRCARLSNFLLGTELGRSISVAITLLSLWFLGAFVMMGTEGWNLLQGLYYSTFALLTVGHGDLTPSTQEGTWFTVFWLPFNVLFVTLYLGSVAHIFVRLSNKNTDRIERWLKRRKQASNQPSDNLSQQLAEKNDQNTDEPTQVDVARRRLRIKQNSTGRLFGSDGTELVTVRDLMRKVSYNDVSPDSSVKSSDPVVYTPIAEDKETVDLSSRDLAFFQNEKGDDNFALRIRVLDRLARIISAQLTDFEAAVEVDGNSLRVTVNSVKDWISLWKIPYGARNIYRQITFESLLFVGEKQIFDLGVRAFLDMSIIEFIELLSPFVFAMKDSKTMQEWLVKTDPLVSEMLDEGLEGDFHPEVAVLPKKDGRRFLKNTVENYFPLNPGNAIRVQLQ